MEVIENALATDFRSKSRRALDEDSDAVVSPTLLLVKIAAKALAPPPAIWLPVLTGAAYGAVMLMRIWATDYYSDLQNLNRGCTVVATVLLSLTLFSLRRVTASEGQLSQLGSGTATISTRAAKRLVLWNATLTAFTAFLLYMAVSVFITYGVMGEPDPRNPIYHLEPGETELTVLQRSNAALWSGITVLIYPMLFAWYLALKEASILVSDEVVEARKKIVRTKVDSAEWESIVVPHVLKLIDETLPTLSSGWGDGLVAIWVGIWIQAIAAFALFLHSDASGATTVKKVYSAVGMVLASLSPLFIAHDVAGASSDCDSIMISLNDKRKASLLDAETDSKLQVLERAISHENRGAGIGFVVVGRVVDRSTLTTM